MTGVRDASGLSELGEVFLRDAVSLSEIGEIHIRDAGGLSKVYEFTSPFEATLTGDAFGANGSNSAISVTTSSVTCNTTGGIGAVSYQWVRTDADPASWVIVSPTSQTTAFRAVSVASGVDQFASFRCDVTDSDAPPNTDSSPSITATASNFGGFD